MSAVTFDAPSASEPLRSYVAILRLPAPCMNIASSAELRMSELSRWYKCVRTVATNLAPRHGEQVARMLRDGGTFAVTLTEYFSDVLDGRGYNRCAHDMVENIYNRTTITPLANLLSTGFGGLATADYPLLLPWAHVLAMYTAAMNGGQRPFLDLPTTDEMMKCPEARNVLKQAMLGVRHMAGLTTYAATRLKAALPSYTLVSANMDTFKLVWGKIFEYNLHGVPLRLGTHFHAGLDALRELEDDEAKAASSSSSSSASASASSSSSSASASADPKPKPKRKKPMVVADDTDDEDEVDVVNSELVAVGPPPHATSKRVRIKK